MQTMRRRNNRADVSIVVNGSITTLPLSSLTLEHLQHCSPVRTFRWHRGQRHFPGWYWSATDRIHVTYESRLELARLQLADFDRGVCAIRSQPLRLTYLDAEGRARRHVPDFALINRDGLIRIVNVKPVERLADAGVRTLLEAAHGALERHGFSTEIWSGEDPVVFSNISYLAAYRNPRLFANGDLEAARAIVSRTMTVEQAESAVAAVGVVDPPPVLMHLLWSDHVRMDLTRALQPTSVLEAA